MWSRSLSFHACFGREKIWPLHVCKNCTKALFFHDWWYLHKFWCCNSTSPAWICFLPMDKVSHSHELATWNKIFWKGVEKAKCEGLLHNIPWLINFKIAVLKLATYCLFQFNISFESVFYLTKNCRRNLCQSKNMLHVWIVESGFMFNTAYTAKPILLHLYIL